ncbi:hypothetical protein ACF06X_33805 [Streptomyces sp. NPDC015346]|uniref:hypothetical protein n=1 Tax=Streptomyces sp. NPDC015346 TaxID=3364954 RepID=UPI0036FB2889
MRWERRKVLFHDPVNLTGDSERDALACALQAIEAREGERRGWDQPPRLWTLHLADIDTGAVELRVVPPREWAGTARNPADSLSSWALSFPEPGPVAPLRFADSGDGFAGVAFMTEGYTAPDDAPEDPEEMARRAAGERTFLTRPDRVEVRMITAVDINGHSYMLRRLRGRQPEIVATGDHEGAAGDSRGRVPHALSRIAHAGRTGFFANH